MNPQKKLIQLELAKELLMAEVTGRRAQGITQNLDYLRLFKMLVSKSEGIVDFMEEEATKNMQDWQAEQSGFNNAEVEDEAQQS